MLLGTTVTHCELRAVTATRDHRQFVAAAGHARRLAALLAALPAGGRRLLADEPESAAAERVARAVEVLWRGLACRTEDPP